MQDKVLEVGSKLLTQKLVLIHKNRRNYLIQYTLNTCKTLK